MVPEQNHDHGLLDEGAWKLYGCISKETWTLSYDGRSWGFTGTAAATSGLSYMCHQFSQLNSAVHS